MAAQILTVDVAVKPDYNFALEWVIKEYKRIYKVDRVINVRFVLVDVVVTERGQAINYRFRFNVILCR